MESFKKEDFANSNEIRWCPGCGDYAILTALQKTLAILGRPPHQHVFVSGIGCAGRLPYYLNTYGLHTIHGRALPVATGLKIMRPELAVWVITGDGDALSIGGNHLLHCLRRNVDLTILLINNQVYGLTKGQFSPTSKKGQVTKTSPDGTNQEPSNPLMIALAAGASFVARAIDKDINQLVEILKQAYNHAGCSFVEIYQDCHIFNPGAFDRFALKTNRHAQTIVLANDKPLIFGDQQALALKNEQFICINYHENDTAFIHDSNNYLNALRLAQLTFPEFPVPLGVYYTTKREVFSLVAPTTTKQMDDLPALFHAKASWQV